MNEDTEGQNPFSNPPTDEGMQMNQDETFDEVLNKYGIAKDMYAKVSNKFTGLKVTIHQPLAGVATGDIDEVSDTYGDNAKVVLNTFPSYITDLGKSIAGKARNLVRDNSAKVPSTNGYLVHKSKLRNVEIGLLSYKGISDSDYSRYDEEMLQEAQQAINIRLAQRKGIAAEKNLPVTFTGYCNYVRDNFEQLIGEILDEYGDNADIIRDNLPTTRHLERANFIWYHYAEVPELMMYGETSLKDIIDGMRRDEQAEEKIRNTVMLEIERFQDQCRDAVSAVQFRVRSEIADQLRDFVNKCGQSRVYKRDGREVTLPRNITDASLTKLSNRIDSLTSEITDVADNDEFYRQIREFKSQLGEDIDLEDSEVREQTRDNAERIIEMCLDEDIVDSNTGQFFASII